MSWAVYLIDFVLLLLCVFIMAPFAHVHPDISLCLNQINNTAVGHALVLPARRDLRDFLKNVLTCHVCLGKLFISQSMGICPAMATKVVTTEEHLNEE